MKPVFFSIILFSILITSCADEAKSYNNQGNKEITIIVGFGLEDFLKSYLISSASTKYTATMEAYYQKYENKPTFSISGFVQSFEKVYPSEAVVRLFNSMKCKGLKVNASNQMVIDYLENEYKIKTQALEEELKMRIDKMTSETPIFYSGNKKGEIKITLKGIASKERAYNFLIATAQLDFYEVYSQEEIKYSLEKAIAKCNDLLTASLDSTTSIENIRTFESYLRYDGYSFGNVLVQDQAIVSAYLNKPEVQELFPDDMKIMWSLYPEKGRNNEQQYILYPVKLKTNKVTSKDVATSQVGMTEAGQYSVNLTMTEEGAEKWRIMTGENVGRQIAITIDDKILSAPIVRGEISQGSTEISGVFSKDEAEDLAALISLGSFSIPFIIKTVK